MISTKEFSIDNTGSIDVTNKLQEIIDYASDKKEMLKIEAGIYLISAIYLKSNLKFELNTSNILDKV